MKKIVSGVLVGLLLLAGTSVFAESISKLVGEKVQGLYTIEKNGKALGEAVIIDGKAYAPVRVISDAAGISLTVEGKKITMTDITVNEAGDYVLGPEALKLANEQAKLRGTVSSNKIMLTAAQSALKMYQDSLTADNAKETPIPGYADGIKVNITKAQEEITRIEQLITKTETEIENLQKQIDEMKP
ncbi:hypothetical protein KDC22_14515 [Paenibacillus tritici]|uniref:hypothetical protein n=1 Tax=Paenibacillus tritici TaxID=1873425 RepID=UPI001BA73437|nr:hypothetical protein [Paenibacillus tritici]QUL57580.1 hypothetical protein KDC22_14515 [Paenibacillus tritici]